LLQAQLELFSKVTIIVDALDEYKDLDSRKEFLKELEKLPSVVRFLITCRPPLPTLDGQLGNHAAFEVETREEDIRRYIEWRIPREPRLMNQVQQYPPLEEEIISSISEKANDMILLARLHMDSIVRLRTRNRISSTLKVLPAEVNKSYDEALKRIFEQENEDAELAKAVLFWVASTSRALSISELQHAMAMHDALSPHDDLPTENVFEYQPIMLPSEPRKLTLASIEGSLVEEEVLLNVCAGLVRMDEKRKTTHLVHRTLQNYLEDRIKKECPELHQVIAATCLAYLSLDDFATGYCKDDDEMGARFRDFALLKYAARYWGHHAREVQSDDSIRQLALRFLESSQPLSSAVQVMHLSEYTYAGYSQHFPSDVTPLQIVVYFNLEIMVKDLIKQGANINAKDQNGWTALHRAAENGYDSLVQILLDNKADVNYNAAYGGTALHRAAKNGHEKVAKLLVKENIEIDAEDQYGGTALHRAARGGKVSIVDLLVQSGAEIDRPYRLEVVIKLFTEQFPRMHSPRAPPRSDTYNPAWGTLSAAMRFLEAAQVRTERLRGGTALHEAVAADHIPVVSFLLDHEAKVDAMDNFGGTALQRATAQGNSRIVKALLHAGADVNRRYQLKAVSKIFSSTRCGGVDHSPGGTPLHQAAKDGNIEIGQILLHHGARCDERDENYRTPLHVAVMFGNIEIAQILLHHGARCDETDKDYETPLHIAVMLGHEKMVDLLIAGGADLNLRHIEDEPLLFLFTENDNGDRIFYEPEKEPGKMPIQLAAQMGHLAVVKVLLAAGAEINHDYPSRRTALMLAIRERHSQIAVLLLENGAKFEKGRHNDLPIHAAARFGLVEVLRVLLEKGQPVDCEGSGSSKTPLEVAIRAGQEAAALFLLSKGANLAVYGESAIQAAIESNNEGLFRLLLGKIESWDWSKEEWANSLRTGLRAAVQSETSREEGYAVGILVECLSRGVDINSKGEGLDTLLLSATCNQQRRIVEYLLDHGAKVSVADNCGRTPLFWAISRGDEEIASLLLEHGADPNIYDDDGYTPLRKALEKRRQVNNRVKERLMNRAKETLITSATLLLDNGADPNIPDKKGQTVLLVAANTSYANSTEFVSLLLSKNADPNIPSEDGETPLSVAKKGKNHDVVELLLRHGAQPAKQERNSS
jgi:ankyrin repeat protein